MDAAAAAALLGARRRSSKPLHDVSHGAFPGGLGGGAGSGGGSSSSGGGGGGSSNLRAFEAGQERQAARKAAQALRLRRGSVGTAGLPPSRANESFTAWKTASSAAAVDPNELFGNAAFSPVKVPSTRA